MKRVLLTIVFAVLIMSTAIFAQERIAVFPFEDMENIFTRNELFMLYDEFSNEFTNRNGGRFRVVERQDVERLIDTEYNFQLHSKFSEKEKTAEYERVLNGAQILSGRIGRLGNSIRITVSLFTYPELVRLPGGVTVEVANKNELFRKIPDLVRDMQNEIAGRPITNTTEKVYKIGDTGPAGGIVFFDRGFVGDGWRYLEAAPAGSEWRGIEWGAYQQNVVNTGPAVGMGKRNTQLIVEHLNRIGETNRAAQLCANLDINGFKDWFLPSIDELNLMYNNLKQEGVGGATYWSSSQYNDRQAWNVNFNNGNGSLPRKDAGYSVRAIRAF